MLDTLMTDTQSLVRAHGPVVVGVVIFLESFGAPLPGESLLVLSGVLAARDEISLGGLLAWAWCGAVLGDCVGYLIGRSVGQALIVRFGGRIGLTPARFARVEAVFARYGPVAVAFARFFDILRQLNGLAAGTLRMPFPRFLMFNVIGGFLWIATWGLGAWYFSGHIANVDAFVRHLGPLGIAALVAAAAVAVGGVIWLAKVVAPARKPG